MLATTIVCPHCTKALKATKPLALGKKVLCKQCGTTFRVTSSDVSSNTPFPTAVAAGMSTAIAPTAPVAVLAGSAAVLDDEPITTEIDGGRILKIGFVALVLAAGLFFIGGGSVLALVYVAHQSHSQLANAKPDTPAPELPKPPDGPGNSPDVPVRPNQNPIRPVADDPEEQDPKKPHESEPVTTPRLPPEEQEKVNKAI
jgi:hypothetical protein